MKAYKFSRSYTGVHWSMGGTDFITYIPELDIFFYNSGNNKGISTYLPFIKECKDYISDVIGNKIPKIHSNLEKLPTAYVNSNFKKEIPQHTIGTTTHMPVYFCGFQELDIDITAEKLKEIISVNEIVVKEKEKLDNFIKDFPQLTSKNN